MIDIGQIRGACLICTFKRFRAKECERLFSILDYFSYFCIRIKNPVALLMQLAWFRGAGDTKRQFFNTIYK
jgi:hypothetical protein